LDWQLVQELQQKSTQPLLDIASLLIKPVQRLPRYRLLLQEVLKVTPDYHPDHATLLEAIDVVKTIILDINQAKKLEDDRVALIEIAKKIDGCKVHTLLVVSHQHLAHIVSWHGMVRKLPNEAGISCFKRPPWRLHLMVAGIAR
jgi:hypothetical protein